MSIVRPPSGVAVSHRYYDSEMTMAALFEGQVSRRPDKVAVIEGTVQTTYAELAHLAAAIARNLRQDGVTRGSCVGIFAGRGVLNVAAQLAVLSIGAAFVPLDPAAGPTNIDIAEAATLDAIACPLDLIQPAVKLARDGCPVVQLDLVKNTGATFASDLATGANDLAYVIYTSGSTGRPKGVMVAHRGVCRLVRGQTYAYLGPDQVMLNMAAVGFDACIGEVYSAILNGGTLVILPDAVPSLDRIAQVIADNNVTIAYITAGLFHIIAEHNPQALAPLQQVFPCGDVLSQPHVKRMRDALPDLRMINGYGPTENTVFTCCYTIDQTWDGGPIPIGHGLAEDHLLVLDDQRLPVTGADVGQLAVGGAGVALGYLGRPDLTAAAFVTLSDQEGLFYLTGDLVSRSADGVIRFHGRLDRQIKINGQRVELDLVEHALRADPAVQDGVAVAVAHPGGGKQIVAVIVPKNAAGDPQDTIRAVLDRLRVTLPAAAVPSRIEIHDRFALSSSGKVDRKRLVAELEQGETAHKSQAVSLRDKIRETWATVLGRDIPTGDATFFDLGGTSLQLIAVHTALQTQLGRRFDIAKLFQAPRVRDLERVLGAQETGQDPIAARRAQMAQRRGQS